MSDRDESSEPSDPSSEWTLKLYIAGQTPRSTAAFVNLKEVCEKHPCHTLILYGSWARGDATALSDCDLLAIRRRGDRVTRAAGVGVGSSPPPLASSFCISEAGVTPAILDGPTPRP